MPSMRTILPVSVAVLALAGCSREGELVVDQGVGVAAVRTSCPAVGIPQYTGDVTTFSRPGDTSLASLDVTATMTNLRNSCSETGERVYTEATFDVLARRNTTAGARTVQIPYFVTVLQGGTAVQSKRVGQVTVTFADGQDRAVGQGRASSWVDRSAATLPEEIRERITRRRRPGDADAALDPLADPDVRAAVRQATFEMLIGFQLSEDQLAYNVTR
ncbi:hypothetical protein [Qipengyuania sp. JC766]|uniref:hypothetical protein n=1 Tax=Qipengyuania sp. JC766 TaxID=3232139 RepID=UPI0034593C66